MRIIDILTPRQSEAVKWATNLTPSHRKHMLQARPEDLPKNYRKFWRYPFGIPEWNENVRLLRRLYWQGKILIGEKKQ